MTDNLLLSIPPPSSFSCPYASDDSPADSIPDEDEVSSFYELYMGDDDNPVSLSTCQDIGYFDYYAYLDTYYRDVPVLCVTHDHRTTKEPVSEKIRSDISAESTCLTCRINFIKRPSRCPNCGKPVVIKERT